MKKFCLIFVLFLVILAGCQKREVLQEEAYQNISQEEAKRIMDTENDVIVLDVRTPEEFAEGHIPNAICIPDYEIAEKAEEVLTDKDRMILVYCRSGRRSKLASEILKGLGYTKIREFGGIIDWKYDVVK